MKWNLTTCIQFGLIILQGIFLLTHSHAQTPGKILPLKIPLQKQDLSLYNYASVRMESGSSEKPPWDITRRNFNQVKEVFPTDNLKFADSIKFVWIKFQVNNQSEATTLALLFPKAVTKAVLYKVSGDSLQLVGKTGFIIAVFARDIPQQENRIDMEIPAHIETGFLIQVILFNGGWMPQMPVLQNIAYADMNSFSNFKKFKQPGLLWDHFFTGIFFMFFVFGLIKYLLLGKDKVYLYYALLGLFSAILILLSSEYPALELPWFENFRGIELYNLVYQITLVFQGLFILKILELKAKYPKITIVAKWYFVVKILLVLIITLNWYLNQKPSWDLYTAEIIDASVFLLLTVGWVVYLATIRKGFFRFIFWGALIICLTNALMFIIRYFRLYHLLPAWFGADPRASVQHFYQVALVIDMLFYFAGLAYRDREVEKQVVQLKQMSMELEMAALRAQMNPHFIFNSLNSINRFILQNNKAQASAYLTKFSRLVRLILQNSQESLITLESEIESLQLYLELEALRFDDHFDFKIKMDDGLDPSLIRVPPLIIQPFTENAIWHGLMHKEEKGLIEIELFQKEDKLCCLIRDDGIGREKSALLKNKSASTHKSMGMKITASRIEMLQQMKQIDSLIKIVDLKLPNGYAGGTEVIITIPLIKDYQFTPSKSQKIKERVIK